MTNLPSSSKSLDDGELRSYSEEEIELIGEVQSLTCSTPNKRGRFRKQKKPRRHSSASISNKSRLKRFDKSIRNPNDGELIDIASDDEDILILEEDDIIEIVEHVGRRICVDLTLEENIENHEEASVNEGNESSKSVMKNPAVTDEEVTAAGIIESLEHQTLGALSDAIIENQERMQVDNEENAAEDVQNENLVEMEEEPPVESQSEDLTGEEIWSQSRNKTSSTQIRMKDPVEFCRLFVSRLNDVTTEESLKEYFEKWGEVFDTDIKIDERTNRSRGFGFVTYTQKHMVDEVQKNRPHKVDGQLIHCRRSFPTKISYPGENVTELFVPIIEEKIKEKDLAEYFTQFGEILSCRLITQRGGSRLRRFGFITFRDYDSVHKILIIKYHKIKGCHIIPRACLTKEQMAEKDLKYYLKYFGGFNAWPMAAIEDWIRRHPEICNSNSPYRENIQGLRAEASSEMFMWGGFWACSSRPTNSTTSTVSVSHRDLRLLEMSRGSSPYSRSTSQLSCSSTPAKKAKIKIEIDSDDEADIKLNSFDKDAYLQAVKEERLTPLNEDLTRLDVSCSSQIKTEPMTD